jgi:hypothetical protein
MFRLKDNRAKEINIARPSLKNFPDASWKRAMDLVH